MPVEICFSLLMQTALRAAARTRAKTGKRIAARIAIIAMTTSSSISVKAWRRSMGLPPGANGVVTIRQGERCRVGVLLGCHGLAWTPILSAAESFRAGQNALQHSCPYGASEIPAKGNSSPIAMIFLALPKKFRQQG